MSLTLYYHPLSSFGNPGTADVPVRSFLTRRNACA